MNEVLLRLVAHGYIVPLGLAFFGGLVGITAIVATQWQKVRQAELEALLKQKMLEQGLSPEQIKMVLEASPPPRKTRSPYYEAQLSEYQLKMDARLRKAEMDARLRKAELEARLKQEMLRRGMSAEEIKQVLEATRPEAAAKGAPEAAIV
jgi:DNA-binding transcriptional MerR regulator